MKIKSIFVLASLLFISLNKADAQFYVSAMPAFYTSAGNIGDRLTMDIEFGKQWDVFSLGVELGKTNFSKHENVDTTLYTEIHANLNVFQQGKFTNTITIGSGYIFNAMENIMFEATTGIEYSISNQLHANVFFGTYYFSGKSTASNNNFFGISLVHFFQKKKKV